VGVGLRTCGWLNLRDDELRVVVKFARQLLACERHARAAKAGRCSRRRVCAPRARCMHGQNWASVLPLLDRGNGRRRPRCPDAT
jgi:hypothetical protein